MTEQEAMPNVPIPAARGGLLLSRDLIFTSKITGTARELGSQVTVAGNLALAEALIRDAAPRVVFVDLAAGEWTTREVLERLIRLAGAAPFVAFGSHVDTERLESARLAGCAQVLPRSKFTAQLPELVRQYLLAE